MAMMLKNTYFKVFKYLNFKHLTFKILNIFSFLFLTISNIYKNIFKLFYQKQLRSHYLTSSDFAHTAGRGEVLWVEVGEGQFIKVKVTGRLAQTQQVQDGLYLASV